jgi:hypothetical protein
MAPVIHLQRPGSARVRGGPYRQRAAVKPEMAAMTAQDIHPQQMAGAGVARFGALYGKDRLGQRADRQV